MTQLKRPVLLSRTDDQLQILLADSACLSCPAPCRPVVAAPDDAIPADLLLPSNLLNRLALAFFGMPLLLIGIIIYSLDGLTGELLSPIVLVSGMVLACVVGGTLARRDVRNVVSELRRAEIV